MKRFVLSTRSLSLVVTLVTRNLGVTLQYEAKDSRPLLTAETTLVPAWWFIEITNLLAMAERKGRSPTLLYCDLSKLGIEPDNEAPNRALRIFLGCREHID